jgi:hypothetical protein
MKEFNDNLEIEGDLRDEYEAVQEADLKLVNLTDIVANLIKEMQEKD